MSNESDCTLMELAMDEFVFTVLADDADLVRFNKRRYGSPVEYQMEMVVGKMCHAAIDAMRETAKEYRDGFLKMLDDEEGSAA